MGDRTGNPRRSLVAGFAATVGGSAVAQLLAMFGLNMIVFGGLDDGWRLDAWIVTGLIPGVVFGIVAGVISWRRIRRDQAEHIPLSRSAASAGPVMMALITFAPLLLGFVWWGVLLWELIAVIVLTLGFFASMKRFLRVAKSQEE